MSDFTNLKIELCKNNDLSKLKELYDNGDNMKCIIDYDNGDNFGDDCESLLDLACVLQHSELAKWLLSIGLDSNGNNGLPLRAACSDGDFELVKCLYDKGADIHADEDHAFNNACKYGHIDIVKWFYEIDKTMDVNTGLSYASNRENHFEIIELLLSWNADIHYLDDLPMQWAIHGNCIENVKFLYNKGATIHCHNDYPLKKACEFGYFELLQWLFTKSEFGQDVINCGFRLACENDRIHIAGFLYTKGANIHSKDDFPIRNACYRGCEKMAKWLYSMGADIHVLDDYLISCATTNGHLHIIKWLYTLGLKINRSDIIEKCYEKGHMEILKWLLLIDMDIYEPTLLYKLGVNGQLEIIKWFYVNGKDIQNDGNQCFYMACGNNKKNIVDWFVQFPNIVENIKFGFNVACTHGYLDMAKYLLTLIENKNDPEITLYSLINTCCTGHYDIMLWLLSINNNHNYQNAFNAACQRGHSKIAKYLFDNFEIQSVVQNYAFRGACKEGHLDMAKWLWSKDNIYLHVYTKVNVIDELDNTIQKNEYGNLVEIIHHQNTNCDVFELTCLYGKLDVAKWLVSIGVKIDSNNNQPFKSALFNQKTNVAKWITTLDGFNFRYYDDLFDEMCRREKYESAKFLLSFARQMENDNKKLVRNMINEDIANFEIFKFRMNYKLKDFIIYDENVFDVIVKNYLIY